MNDESAPHWSAQVCLWCGGPTAPRSRPPGGSTLIVADSVPGDGSWSQMSAAAQAQLLQDRPFFCTKEERGPGFGAPLCTATLLFSALCPSLMRVFKWWPWLLFLSCVGEALHFTPQAGVHRPPHLFSSAGPPACMEMPRPTKLQPLLVRTHSALDVLFDGFAPPGVIRADPPRQPNPPHTHTHTHPHTQCWQNTRATSQFTWLLWVTQKWETGLTNFVCLRKTCPNKKGRISSI